MTQTLSPETVARLDAARVRLADANRFTAELDAVLLKLAALDVCVSATPAGHAWHEVEVRTRIWRKQITDEIDALLDGDEGEAESCASLGARMQGIVNHYLDKLIAEGHGFLRRPE